MKKYLFGVFAIALAIGFSAFKTFAPDLTVAPATVDATNVLSGATYNTSSISCPGSSTNPCVLDLSLIEPEFEVSDEASFLSYLSSEFSTSGAQVAEVNRIAYQWKN